MLPGVGVFGTGSTARVLVPLLRAEGFSVEAVWGRTEEEARQLAGELGISFYTSQTDCVLLHQDVELVCINIPPPLTRQIAVKALGIGKNVICEKAATSVDAFKMVTAARYYPKLMSLMGNVLRFLPAFVRMKQLIDEGYVGEVMVCDVRVYWGSLLSNTYNWICDELMGGGGLHTMGSYIVDLLSHLTGQRAEKVHGLLKTFVKQNGAIRGIRHVTSDDFCFFQMLMSGGICSTVTLNFNMPGAFVHEVMVVGSAGRLVARGTDLYGQKNTAFQEELLLADTSRLGMDVEKGLREVPFPYLKGMVYMVQALRQSFEEQEDRRTWEHKPVSMAASFEDGLYMQSVVDAIKQSSRSGEWEVVEIMTEEPDANQNLCEALQRNNL
ncbi:glucose-fructose oxidoreductase domain-containing protein 2-like [Polyodon spathula]|uniref:glucose-fructose oxidoreductase domain-containing protein 2-like n=1 Tax=Polyodon spathula TaxID=7913 RepID=UPI001B7DFEC8|nr:glucose-fructose oxidoreductase domain-containing protein 2-like [Polyodon spathula]XP_041124184.1 glucose-fructose oxidoreductase domain-containing protein 2-like [Polyodon spathula]XP_041124185.1 glucose-fructose oxidoreductase domain-containing protein 2-like [Polyodon spathula]XP_041124186.1 glucose-fructose oxidoreductase domain-containing protein 2-like [Polyodon spathula]XP_041124187.1 glucose-fructose oxidoreductase domain-containing protein 2-like [Polyodon spathula]XP_041124188.1 